MRPALLLAAALAAGLLALVPPAAAQAPFDPLNAGSFDPRPGALVPPRTALRDEAGRPVRLGDLARGLPTVLAPVYYRCPNICGLTLDGLMRAADGSGLVPGRDFNLLAFSIDPRETPAVAADSLREHLAAYPGLAGGAHFLTADAATAKALAGSLGVGYAFDEASGQYAHPAVVAVLTPAGVIARYLRGLDLAPTDLRLALVESGEGRIGTLVDHFRLLCFGYDPKTGRYTATIIEISRLMGGGTVLLIAGGVGAYLWRERRAARRRGAQGRGKRRPAEVP